MRVPKPCPFCGSTLVVIQNDSRRYYQIYGTEGYTEYYVYCPICCTRGPSAWRHHRSIDTVQDEAVEKWNRRASNE